MTSPVSQYDKVAKEFNVVGDKCVPTEVKLRFAREQATEQASICNRLIFDIVTTNIYLDAAKDDTTMAAYAQKLAGYQNDLRQMSASLGISLSFVDDYEDLLNTED